MKHTLRKNARVASFLRKALKPVFAACVIAPVFGSTHAAAQLYWNSPAAGSWDQTAGNMVWSTNAAGTIPAPWTDLNPAIFGSNLILNGVVVTVDAAVQPKSGGGFSTITFNKVQLRYRRRARKRFDIDRKWRQHNHAEWGSHRDHRLSDQ